MRGVGLFTEARISGIKSFVDLFLLNQIKYLSTVLPSRLGAEKTVSTAEIPDVRFAIRLPQYPDSGSPGPLIGDSFPEML